MTTGKLYIIGIGPGNPSLRTTEVNQILPTLTDLVGYTPYLTHIEDVSSACLHPFDNREELDRAKQALTLAQQGKRVGVISSGDPGVFAMASTIFEAIEKGDPVWKALDVVVLPGVSAMFAAAARLGAPLGNDFCAISLSDNLKPWELILRRLRLACEGDFVIGLYNTVSHARPWQLNAAFNLLRPLLPPSTPVAFARAISHKNETIRLTTLQQATSTLSDMRTLVLIGNRFSRVIPRKGNLKPWFYTPRSVQLDK